MDEYEQVKGDERAQVEIHVGTQYNFGEAKVDATVRLTCNQDEKTLYRASELAFRVAKSVVDTGLNILAPPISGPPLIQQPQSPPTYGAPR